MVPCLFSCMYCCVWINIKLYSLKLFVLANFNLFDFEAMVASKKHVKYLLICFMLLYLFYVAELKVYSSFLCLSPEKWLVV